MSNRLYILTLVEERSFTIVLQHVVDTTTFYILAHRVFDYHRHLKLNLQCTLTQHPICQLPFQHYEFVTFNCFLPSSAPLTNDDYPINRVQGSGNDSLLSTI